MLCVQLRLNPGQTRAGLKVEVPGSEKSRIGRANRELPRVRSSGPLACAREATGKKALPTPEQFYPDS